MNNRRSKKRPDPWGRDDFTRKTVPRQCHILASSFLEKPLSPLTTTLHIRWTPILNQNKQRVHQFAVMDTRFELAWAFAKFGFARGPRALVLSARAALCRQTAPHDTAFAALLLDGLPTTSRRFSHDQPSNFRRCSVHIQNSMKAGSTRQHLAEQLRYLSARPTRMNAAKAVRLRPVWSLWQFLRRFVSPL